MLQLLLFHNNKSPRKRPLMHFSGIYESPDQKMIFFAQKYTYITNTFTWLKNLKI